jgi:hypothetical protein
MDRVVLCERELLNDFNGYDALASMIEVDMSLR